MRRSLVTVLFACIAASAGTVSISNTGFEISATVSRSADGPILIQDQASISVDYSLLFMGGTGTGTFSPLIIDDGVLNESSFPDLWPRLGGYGFVTSPVTLSAGDPDPGSHPFAAQAFCSPTDGCLLPFTFGVPIDLHFDASVNAQIEADTGNATLSQAVAPFTTSIQFDGVTAFDSRGNPISSNDVDLNLVPEPSTFPVLLTILAVGLAFRRRH